MACLFMACLFMACLRIVYGLFTGCLRIVYGLFTACLRLVYGLFMDFSDVAGFPDDAFRQNQVVVVSLQSMFRFTFGFKTGFDSS